MSFSARMMLSWMGTMAAAFGLLTNTAAAQTARYTVGYTPTLVHVGYVVSSPTVGPVSYSYGYTSNTSATSTTTSNTNSNTSSNPTRFHILNSVTGQGPTGGQPVQIITSFPSGNTGGNTGFGGLGGAFGSTGTGYGGGNGGATPPPGVLLSAQYASTFFPSGSPTPPRGVGTVGFGYSGFGYPGAGYGGYGGYGTLGNAFGSGFGVGAPQF